MNSNSIMKLLTSLPVILVLLYFIPFLGIILLIVRKFVNNKKHSTSISLFVIGIILLIPKIISIILNLFNISISYINDIINSEIYNNLLSYSKLLITIGIIFFVLSFIFKGFYEKLKDYLKSYIKNKEQTERQIDKENDMEIKIKQEKAKNTKVVYCPFCGADNIITSKTGKCKYCRRTIS